MQCVIVGAAELPGKCLGVVLEQGVARQLGIAKLDTWDQVRLFDAVMPHAHRADQHYCALVDEISEHLLMIAKFGGIGLGTDGYTLIIQENSQGVPALKLLCPKGNPS
jgi:hypothetical protein